jgi:hypothetical protein
VRIDARPDFAGLSKSQKALQIQPPTPAQGRKKRESWGNVSKLCLLTLPQNPFFQAILKKTCLLFKGCH